MEDTLLLVNCHFSQCVWSNVWSTETGSNLYCTEKLKLDSN